MNKESREEVLCRLLNGALTRLDAAPSVVRDDDDGRAYVRDLEDFLDDCREFVASLVETQWAPGTAPPGIAEVQAELKERQADERQAARKKRKAVLRKAANRRRN